MTSTASDGHDGQPDFVRVFVEMFGLVMPEKTAGEVVAKDVKMTFDPVTQKLLSYISLGVRVLALLVTVCGLAEARPLGVRQSYPAAEAIVNGRNAQYIVRFDGWVDHAASRLDITANGKIVETLVPTRDSEPDVLAASAPALAPGRYQLHWHVKSWSDGDFSNGFVSFTVDR
jgi:methionine-rich copper-binding protein CopC